MYMHDAPSFIHSFMTAVSHRANTTRSDRLNLFTPCTTLLLRLRTCYLFLYNWLHYYLPLLYCIFSSEVGRDADKARHRLPQQLASPFQANEVRVLANCVHVYTHFSFYSHHNNGLIETASRGNLLLWRYCRSSVLFWNVLGCFTSFVRFYESTLNCNISVNTYLI